LTTKDDLAWTLSIQPYAVEQVYNILWSGCEIKHLDDGIAGSLKTVLDVAGGDKLIKWPNGTVLFLGQRFRRYESYVKKNREFDDFTLRYDRPRTGYKAECFKAKEALQHNKLLAAYYGYGHVNKEENGFRRFRVIDFIKFLKYWEQGLLPKPDKIPNPDGSSTFLAWPFSKIPQECIIWQKPPKKLSLSKFMDGNYNGTISSQEEIG